MENSIAVPQKIKNRIIIWSSNSLPGYISEGIKISISKGYLHTHVHCNIIHNSQDMETRQVSKNGRMDKESVVCVCVCIYIYIYTYTHTHTHFYYILYIYIYKIEDYATMKKKETLFFATTWTEISQTEKHKYCMISLICGI